MLRLSLLTGHNQMRAVRIFWSLLVSGECFSFLSSQEMNTSTKGKGYWAGLLEPANKGGGITKVFSAEGRNSYLLVHNVAEQLSQSVQIIMMQVTCHDIFL